MNQEVKLGDRRLVIYRIVNDRFHCSAYEGGLLRFTTEGDSPQDAIEQASRKIELRNPKARPCR